MKQNPKTTNKKPTFSHDSFFKHFYSDPNLAKELFQLIFSKQTREACNWNKLKTEKDTFKGKRADLIFSVPLKNHPKIRLKLFILLEHKSQYEKALYSQFLGYQVLMREHNIQFLGCAMPIAPVLFNHGKRPFKWKKTLPAKQVTYPCPFYTVLQATFENSLLYRSIRRFWRKSV